MYRSHSYSCLEPMYEKLHNVFVVRGSGESHNGEVLIRIIKNSSENEIIIRVRDLNDIAFYFISKINNCKFAQMKVEQSLDITFDELTVQLVDLLKEVESMKMLLRLEVEESNCTMYFYEKSRLKSLIFLTITLQAVDKSEIIHEMSSNISKLTDLNKQLTLQVKVLNQHSEEKSRELQVMSRANSILRGELSQFLENFTEAYCQSIGNFEFLIKTKLNGMQKKIHSLDSKLRSAEGILKEKSNKLELTEQLLNVCKTEQETLKMEKQRMNILKQQSDEQIANLHSLIEKKDSEMSALKAKVEELKTDNQEATLIIAQKSKTQEEIAKDLVQANTMLVNFNNQYHALSQEVDSKREQLMEKDRMFSDKLKQLKDLQEEFAAYRRQYGAEQLHKLQAELLKTQKAFEEIEKRNKEVDKLNGLLTRKLSAMEVVGSSRSNIIGVPPSQRSNY